MPDLRVITTSREPLGVAGELAWRVPSLDDETAIDLFVERAGAVRPGYAPDSEERDADRADLPAPRRHAAGHRAGGRPRRG